MSVLRIDGVLASLSDLEERLDASLEVGYIRFTVNDDTYIELADTYYPIEGTFDDIDLSKDFTDAADGIVTYTGPGGKFILSGTSDVFVQEVGIVQLTYGLEVNGTVPTGAETPHTFPVQSNTENLAISGIVILTTGDVIQVKVKSNTADKTITVETLNVVLNRV